MANLAGGLFQCFPGSGSLTRSAVNQQSGAVSQWSGVISAITVAGTVLALAPLAYHIPRASLAGILVLTAWRMIDRRQLAYYLRATKFDAGIVIATAVSAVAVSVEFCVLIGTFLSFVLYVPRAGKIHLTQLVVTPERVVREWTEGDVECRRLRIYDLEGELFFGAAPDLERQLEAVEGSCGPGVRVVVLRVKRMRNPDAVSLEAFEGFVERLGRRGIVPILCGVRAELADALERAGVAARLGAQGLLREGAEPWSSTLAAVRRAYEIFKDDLCPHCPRRDDPPGAAAEPGWYYMI
jgi:SulP family sulfate permease